MAIGFSVPATGVPRARTLAKTGEPPVLATVTEACTPPGGGSSTRAIGLSSLTSKLFPDPSRETLAVGASEEAARMA